MSSDLKDRAQALANHLHFMDSGSRDAELIEALVDRITALQARNARLAQALVPHNDILRSAYQIASRQGEDTDWRSYLHNVDRALKDHHEITNDARAALSEETPDTPPDLGTFQERVQPWMMATFGPEISADKMERNHRFLEEAIELVQAFGCIKADVLRLVDYVYGRPQGDVNQEVGGVMITLAAHCLAHGVDMHAAGETELARIWALVDKIRAKHESKPKHSPLPGPTPPAQDTDAEKLIAAYTSGQLNQAGKDALACAIDCMRNGKHVPAGDVLAGPEDAQDTGPAPRGPVRDIKMPPYEYQKPDNRSVTISRSNQDTRLRVKSIDLTYHYQETHHGGDTSCIGAAKAHYQSLVKQCLED